MLNAADPPGETVCILPVSLKTAILVRRATTDSSVRVGVRATGSAGFPLLRVDRLACRRQGDSGGIQEGGRRDHALLGKCNAEGSTSAQRLGDDCQVLLGPRPNGLRPDPPL